MSRVHATTQSPQFGGFSESRTQGLVPEPTVDIPNRDKAPMRGRARVSVNPPRVTAFCADEIPPENVRRSAGPEPDHERRKRNRAAVRALTGIAERPQPMWGVAVKLPDSRDGFLFSMGHAGGNARPDRRGMPARRLRTSQAIRPDKDAAPRPKIYQQPWRETALNSPRRGADLTHKI